VLRDYVVREILKAMPVLSAAAVRKNMPDLLTTFFTSPEYKPVVVILTAIGAIVTIAFMFILTLKALRQMKNKK